MGYLIGKGRYARESYPKAAAAGGGAGGQVASFLWKANSTPSTGVFQVWSQVQTAIDALKGAPYLLAADDSGGALVVPAGAVRFGTGTWRGAGPNSVPAVSLANGVVVDTSHGLDWELDDLQVTSAGGTVPITGGAGAVLVTLQNASFIGSNGAEPFLDAPVGLVACVLSSVSELGLKALRNSGGTVAVDAFGSIIADGALLGPTGFLNISSDTQGTSGPVVVPPGWSALYFSRADQVAFTPQTPANWKSPVPSKVAAALDQLAARITANTNNGLQGAQGPAPSVSITTGAIPQNASGIYLVAGTISGTGDTPTTITGTLLLDGNPTFSPTPKLDITAGAHWTMPITFLVTPGDGLPHGFGIQVTAGAGNLTLTAVEGGVTVYELP